MKQQNSCVIDFYSRKLAEIKRLENVLFARIAEYIEAEGKRKNVIFYEVDALKREYASYVL